MVINSCKEQDSHVSAVVIRSVTLVSRHPRLGLPHILMPLLAPKLLKPLLTLAANPAACEMHEQVAVAIPHVIPALHVRVELALRIDAHVVAHQLVFEHEVFERVLLGAAVLLAHEHRVVGHHFEGPARKGRAPEEGAAGVDRLVVLRDEDVDFFDAEVGGRVDVGRVLFELPVENGRVAH
jgi:hypothetical protein